MPGRVDARLKELDIDLPQPSTPGGSFLPTKRVNNLLFVSGQIPWWNGERKYVGKLGLDFDVEQGVAAARLCGLNILAHAKSALKGDLDLIVGCVRLGGFVNATAGFLNPPLVVNGASNLMIEIFGEAGRHVRTAVGTNVLPGNVAVEVEALFEVS
ncbi:RidA family protein [Pseudorhodoplanes sp.]|uniref:RidA family protein n=1 Tax=Pseudorhodoplanes sp. TaxID=1934341 RepID=UPI003D0C89DF